MKINWNVQVKYEPGETFEFFELKHQNVAVFCERTHQTVHELRQFYECKKCKKQFPTPIDDEGQALFLHLNLKH